MRWSLHAENRRLLLVKDLQFNFPLFLQEYPFNRETSLATLDKFPVLTLQIVGLLDGLRAAQDLLETIVTDGVALPPRKWDEPVVGAFELRVVDDLRQNCGDVHRIKIRVFLLDHEHVTCARGICFWRRDPPPHSRL